VLLVIVHLLETGKIMIFNLLTQEVKIIVGISCYNQNIQILLILKFQRNNLKVVLMMIVLVIR